MVRKSASPKRLRDSGAAASDASQLTNDHEGDADNENRPKKRGRPRKYPKGSQKEPLDDTGRTRERIQSPPKASQAATEDQDGAREKKRGRPPLRQGEGAHDDEMQRGARGRPRTDTGTTSRDTEEKRGDDGAQGRRRKRGRPPAGNEPRQSGEEQVEEAGRRKKPRVSFQDPAQETGVQKMPKRKRGRPSLKDIAPLDARNRAMRAPESERSDADVLGTDAAKPKRGRKTGSRGSLESAATRRAPGDSPEAEERTQEAGDGRRSGQTAQLEADGPPKPFPHVAPKVRGIKQSTIDARWKPLDQRSIGVALEILALAHRPIMQRLASTHQRRQHTASALSILQRRIARKLHRGLPFPPPAVAAGPGNKRGRRRLGAGGGHEAELDFESVLDGSQALERQLDPALHSVELLRRDKERMEKELERDYQNLRNLEAGARGQAREQRDQLKKAHVLLSDANMVPRGKRKKGPDDEDGLEMISVDQRSAAHGPVFKDLEDEQLKQLAMQLSGHVDSMEMNLRQTDGLTTQMAASGASLRNILLRHLSDEQYDNVVLG